MRDFFERAIALRDTIEQSEDSLKNVKLDILSQLVGQVFRYRKIPQSFMLHSDFPFICHLAMSILEDLEIEAQVTSNSKII